MGCPIWVIGPRLLGTQEKLIVPPPPTRHVHSRVDFSSSARVVELVQEPKP